MNRPIRLVNDADDLAERDANIEALAAIFDALTPGITMAGDLVRSLWQDELRALVIPCDCPLNPYHRWNCTLTPIWAQTIRDLDTNPWTAVLAYGRGFAELDVVILDESYTGL